MSELSTAVMSEQDAHRITERIRYMAMSVRDSLEKLQRLVADAQEGQAHVTLGYPSWTAYIADVFSEAPLQLQRQERREVVAWLSGEGMSTRAIAPIVGVHHDTVASDRKAGVGNPTPAPRPTESDLMTGTEWTPEDEPTPPFDPHTGEILEPFDGNNVLGEEIAKARTITGMDGKTYTQPQPKEATPRRPALNDQIFRAVYDLERNIDRLHKLTQDDRFNRQKDEIATRHGSDLIRNANTLNEVITLLN